MTITNADIVLAESEVMTDTTDGGGRMSGNVVDDGAVNNTMPDISRLDRVYGRVNLRKMFLSVRSSNQDTLLGSHTILLRKPVDPRVVVTLFKTGSHVDRRSSAKNRVESYVVKATEADFWLWGTQLSGQRAISCLQRTDGTPPESGQVFTINGGGYEQYVRATKVTVSRRRFSVFIGSALQSFDMNVLSITLSNKLAYDFVGSDPSPVGRGSGAAKILSTQVADASRYFSARPLSVSAAPGDQSVKVDSVYNALVPSAQSENALTDRPAGPGQLTVVPASTTTISVSADDVNLDSEGYAVYYAGRAITPGSLLVSGSNGNYEDNGGKLDYVSGNSYLSSSIVDYQSGVIRVVWTSAAYRNNPITLTFKPGAAVPQQSHTISVAVDIVNRSSTWVAQLTPPPAPGTLVAEYRALGRWSMIADDGGGVMRGDGVGVVNYSTGTISMTLAALPDTDTEIILSWGDAHSGELQIAAAVPAIGEIELNLTVAV